VGTDLIDRAGLAQDFDEAIDGLEAGLRSCPAELWQTSMWTVPRTDPWVWPKPGTDPVPERTDEAIQIFSSVANIAYHCLWFLDFYVSVEPGFQSPDYMRGGPEEMAWPADGAAPIHDWVFPSDVLLRYLAHGRDNARQRLASVSEAELAAPCPPGHPHAGKTLSELLQVNLRHVREHGVQIHDFLVGHGVDLTRPAGQ